jgi:CubicO group peptidase (beta-lactamase class C family)
MIPSHLDRTNELFAENFATFGELGASLCIIRDGQLLINLAGGYCDREKKVAWTDKTPVLIWSATKGLASACLIHAAWKHGIRLDEKVTNIWPEYGKETKAETTFLHILTHRAGQPALHDFEISILDHDAVAAQLAGQRPFWKPGEAHGYHPRTYGFLLDELVRRITGGTPLGTYFQRVFGEPLGLDLWIGIPDSVAARVAPIFAPRKARTPNSEDGEDPFYEALSQPDSLTRQAFLTPAGLNSPSQMNDPAIRRHPLPSLGGIGTAESLARFYGCLCSNQFFPSEIVAQIAKLQCGGADRVLRVETAFGIGFMKDPVAGGKKIRKLFGSSLRAFGQPGSGGSLGFCDPENGVAFGYVMNQMEPGLFPNAKALRIVKHFYDTCL